MLIDDITETYTRQGFTRICGVDEAGRGPLAGPVCAAAVALPPGVWIDGADDSKKLTEKKRERLYGTITAAADWGVAFATVEEITSLNILNAALLAMRRAVEALAAPPDIALIDGNRPPGGLDCPVETIVNGDARCLAIACASIVAKVTRDRLMAEYDAQYPQYGFARHKGYGTRQHILAIGEHGLCAAHRPSFIKGAWLHGAKI